MKEKVFHLAKRIIKHELVSGSMYVFIGFFIASFLGFLVNLFLARNLVPSDYGIYASLLSLLTLASIPNQSITPIVVRFATDFFAKGEEDKAVNFYFKVLKFVLLLSLFIFSIFLLFAKIIGNFLHLDNSWFVILTGLSVSVSYFAIINIAFLQSLLKFSFLAFSYILSALVRISVAIILVFLGFKVLGALFAILVATLIPFLFQFIPLRFLFKKERKKEIKISGQEVLTYALPTLVATLSLMSLTSTDVILVKHFFTSANAGLYGGLSLIGKVIFYFTGPIPSVMFPLLIKRHNLGQNFNNLFYLALILVAVPSFGIIAIYFLFPQLIINIFLGGGNYLEVTNVLGLFGIFITLFSIINVFVNFFLSLKKTGVFVFVFAAAILQIFLINLFHESFFQVVTVSVLVLLGLLILLCGYYIRAYRHLAKAKEELPLAPTVS